MIHDQSEDGVVGKGFSGLNTLADHHFSAGMSLCMCSLSVESGSQCEALSVLSVGCCICLCDFRGTPGLTLAGLRSSHSRRAQAQQLLMLQCRNAADGVLCARPQVIHSRSACGRMARGRHIYSAGLRDVGQDRVHAHNMSLETEPMNETPALPACKDHANEKAVH